MSNSSLGDLPCLTLPSTTTENGKWENEQLVSLCTTTQYYASGKWVLAPSIFKSRKNISTWLHRILKQRTISRLEAKNEKSWRMQNESVGSGFLPVRHGYGVAELEGNDQHEISVSEIRTYGEERQHEKEEHTNTKKMVF
jgi:hypothetical protein